MYSFGAKRRLPATGRIPSPASRRSTASISCETMEPPKVLAKGRNLLAVLVAHDRITSVHEIVDAYRKELQSRLGIHHAEVTTARKLTAEDKASLLEQIGKLAKGQVEATFNQDPAILGGVVVRIGSTVYDGSVLGRVERLREALTH